MFYDEYQSHLEKDLIKSFESIKKRYDKNILTKILEKLNIHNNLPLVRYDIIDSKVQIHKYDNYKYPNIGLVEITEQFLMKTVEWAHKNNLLIPNVSIHVWIIDRFPWELTNEQLESFPFFVFAKPKNINIPIFPEATFLCFQNEKKYTGKCYDWGCY